MRRTLALTLLLPVALLVAPGAAPSPALGPAPAVSSGATDPAEGPRAEEPTTSAPTAEEPTTEGASGADGGPDPEVASPADPATDATPVPPLPTVPTTSADAVPPGTTFLLAAVPDAGGVAGSGPRWTYTVEVEEGLGASAEDVAAQVRAALHDPRSWARDRTMQQVDDPSRARVRVVLASPATVDVLCGRVGLDTAGVYSCWNGRFAALNAWRWDAGATGFPDLTTYRTYLVNHEVGHALGFGHRGCPGEGSLAPVMMQQSKGLDGCVANGWPTP